MRWCSLALVIPERNPVLPLPPGGPNCKKLPLLLEGGNPFCSLNLLLRRSGILPSASAPARARLRRSARATKPENWLLQVLRAAEARDPVPACHRWGPSHCRMGTAAPTQFLCVGVQSPKARSRPEKKLHVFRFRPRSYATQAPRKQVHCADANGTCARRCRKGAINNCEVQSQPPAACATALNSARPLFIVSSHSAAGSESYTMPPPACTCRRPSWITAVRMAMAVSASPHQPM